MQAAAAEARSFGKYTLVAKLATGGMAEIFLARLQFDGGFEKLVCIKRILPHLARDPQFVAMFLDEARVAARISHPNVCQVFELGEIGSQYYIAMEYLEGVPLSLFRRPDYYPAMPDPRLVAGFGVQACEGLHHAHQLKRADGELLGVVHRDVSPQNLFVTVDGVVKVLDFGIAKVQDASSKTSTGAVKGTYAYMAPEQLRNEPLDRRTDVWALGTVLWETLAQRHLFKRDTEFLTFQAITNEPLPDICEVRPDVPPLLGDVIARALSRNRDDRFPSARALGEALAQAVAPLGGAASSAQIGAEVENAFAAMLAEQHTLLRIAREGGQFDLEGESPLVGHGTQIATTPVSNIKRRVQQAQAEVAHFVAAQQAIDSLVDDQSRPFTRPGSDGAFTPAPTRRSNIMGAQAAPQSGPYSVAPAEWRSNETTPMPPPNPTAPVMFQKSSRLPWIIASVAILAAAGAGALLYMNVERQQQVVPAKPAEPPPEVAMHSETAVPADAAIVTVVADAAEVAPRAPIDATERVAAKPPIARTITPSDRHPPRPIVTEKPQGPPGFITIDSAPVYAVIYIDGKKFGDTPLVHITLPAGKHTVKAVSPSGSAKTLSIAIEPGKTAPVRRIEW
jgi:serine/threonine-protein kinase